MKPLVPFLCSTFVSLPLFLCSTGCDQPGAAENANGAAAENETSAVRVQTVVVEKEDLAQTIEMPGTVKGYETADLYAKVGGYLARMDVDIGDRVQGPVISVGDQTIPLRDRENLRRLFLKAGGWTPEAGLVRDVTQTLQELDRIAEKENRQREAGLLRGLAEGSSTTDEVLDRLLGQPLAVLDIPEMKSELKQKAAEIQQALADVAQARASVRQAEAQKESYQASLEESQTLRQEKESNMSLRQAEYGRVGQLVSRGSMIAKRKDEARFQLDAAKAAVRSMAAGVRTAQAQLNAAKANVEKAKTDLTSMQAHVDVARAAYERVETMAQYRVLRAPFDGVVTRRLVDPGAFIQPAEGNSAASPLLTVARTDKVRVSLDLPMNEVRWLDIGDAATFDRVNVLPDSVFQGKVTRFSPALDNDSRMMRVEVDLDNPGRQLMPGYYGYVKVALEEFKQTPVVPSSALMGATGKENEAELFVYVVREGKCRRTTIKTNFKDGEKVGVSSGLTGGEEVVQAGAGQLADGQQVTAVKMR